MTGRRTTRWLFAAVALTLAPAPSPGAEPSGGAERARGRFLASCAVCHGQDRRADTPIARLLDPRPRNFTDPIEMARVTDDRIYRAIKEGRTGTAMSPWSGILNPEDIRRVVLYIRQAFPPGR